ncbi:MAG: hypothetical protein ACRC3Y_10960 [Romboutsia sp.]|uniref:hypothetical protein n=1 Tax=Romboutsia sp. TaxID=1965302 RepID=UPI003F3AA16D
MHNYKNVDEFIDEKFSNEKFEITKKIDDILEIRNKENDEKCNIQIDIDVIEEELLSSSFITEYCMGGEGFITFIIFNKNKDTELDIEIPISNDKYSVEIYPANKLEEDRAILINNVCDLIDYFKVDISKDNLIHEIIRDDIIICDLIIKDMSTIDDNNVDKIINSLLCFLAITSNITLENPRNLIINNFSADKSNASFSIIEDAEPMEYFLTAEKIQYNHLKYLEYYHILEYYFSYHKIKVMDDMIKTLSTEPVEEKSNAYYHKLLNLYEHFSEAKKSKKFTSEQESIRYIVREHLGYHKVCDIINSNFKNSVFLKSKMFERDDLVVTIDSKIIEANKKLKLYNEECNKEQDDFCNSLANRIYEIRNFIVHTKKHEREVGVFIPSQEKLEKLSEDLKLIRLLSFELMLTRLDEYGEVIDN